MASKLYMLVMSLLSVLLSSVHCGTHLDKPWFKWEGGRVPFYFNVTVTNPDRRMFRSMMREIEKKTCLRFQEQTEPPSGHHLEIQGGRPRFSAAVYAEPPANQKVILYSSYKVADRKECFRENKGGLLHEMFHLFGVMHTQMRADRDKYINILTNNIQPAFLQEYTVCEECNDYGVPYDCSSIMHYGAESFSTGQWTMSAKSEDCDLRWVGAAFDGRGASKSDWLLLRRISRSMCSSNKRPRNLSGGKQSSSQRPTRVRGGKQQNLQSSRKRPNKQRESRQRNLQSSGKRLRNLRAKQSDEKFRMIMN